MDHVGSLGPTGAPYVGTLGSPWAINDTLTMVTWISMGPRRHAHYGDMVTHHGDSQAWLTSEQDLVTSEQDLNSA